MARERKFTRDEIFQAVKILLLEHGYEAFTFSLLAEYLDVARGTIYKYYDNKDELITEFMINEMNAFMNDLKKIDVYPNFDAQFDYLFNIMFENTSIHQLIEIGKQMMDKNNEKVAENQRTLERLHLEMYHYLDDLITAGKKEQKIKQQLPNPLILGYIFQAVAIPNHFGVPHQQWVKGLKEIIKYGMSAESK